ncbi:LOB domain-containing protein 6-like [Salvia miltiorrhiza]|uniref:LOB domain-containing protein 6-like n=1 Tax=Salvia miltiorrhiza TaxID=226208 RepID=UPI0025ACB524|nr:LOB domain-containing protein 6-like [Salvia miltiorrhiza]
MTVKGGSTPACAACKYQRRKCSPTCPLAPYFPANQPKMFQNVHRLFGVSNVTKTLDALKTKEQREDAMRSIIYEADMRERFPVDGCSGVIAQLTHQLRLARDELDYVRATIAACREQAALAAAKPADCWLDYAPGEAAAAGFLFNDGACEPCGSDTMSSNLSSIQAQMEAFVIHQKRNVSVDFGAQQFNNAAAVFDDDRQSSYIEPKNEAFESSLDSTLDDAEESGCRREMRGGAATEHGCRRELRSAAAGFSLTTVN